MGILSSQKDNFLFMREEMTELNSQGGEINWMLGQG